MLSVSLKMMRLSLLVSVINAVKPQAGIRVRLDNIVLASKKPETQNFKEWVTHVALTAIRKDGV